MDTDYNVVKIVAWLADCVMTQNVCLLAVYESPYLVYRRQIKDTNL